MEWHPPPLANKFSLSSMLGVADMMYGADAGTGPGVCADGGGDLRADSSGPFS